MTTYPSLDTESCQGAVMLGRATRDEQTTAARAWEREVAELREKLEEAEKEVSRLNKLADAISRDCNATANERNAMQSRIAQLEAQAAELADSRERIAHLEFCNDLLSAKLVQLEAKASAVFAVPEGLANLFPDKSAADALTKAQRVLKSLSDGRDYTYFFDDGFPRNKDIEAAAKATLAVLNHYATLPAQATK